MSPVVIVPPKPLLDAPDVRRHCRIDDEGDDAYLTSLIAVAQGTIDGPMGWLGRSIGVQTLEIRAPGFVTGPIESGTALPFGFALGCGPVIEMVSVAYLDSAGATQTIDPTLLAVEDDVLIPRPGAYWPVPAARPDAVRVRYRAGYPDATGEGGTTLSTVPAPILHALRVMVALLYEGRADAGSVQTNATVASLLGPYRRWRC